MNKGWNVISLFFVSVPQLLFLLLILHNLQRFKIRFIKPGVTGTLHQLLIHTRQSLRAEHETFVTLVATNISTNTEEEEATISRDIIIDMSVIIIFTFWIRMSCMNKWRTILRTLELTILSIFCLHLQTLLLPLHLVRIVADSLVRVEYQSPSTGDSVASSVDTVVVLLTCVWVREISILSHTSFAGLGWLQLFST